MRQRIWFELTKDYDPTNNYHQGKPNVVAVAPSRNIFHIVAALTTSQRSVLEDMKLELKVVMLGFGMCLATFEYLPNVDRKN